MGMFPDDFPFTKRPCDGPVVQATPLHECPPQECSPQACPPQDPSQVVAAPPAAELAAIEAPAAPAGVPFKERRRSPRQRMNAKATLRVDNTGGNPMSIEIDNLSLLGVRFRADRALTVNDKANLRLEIGPLKWATRLRIINCIDGGGSSFTIGCEFVGNELVRPFTAAAAA